MNTNSLQLDIIAEKCRSAQRITSDEAITLWQQAPLWLLSQLATERKRASSGDKVYYNRNFHIEPTNLCRFNCLFCSYRRGKGAPDAWDHSIDEMLQIAKSYVGSGVTEVHIVGGVHPDHSLDFYIELIAGVKAILPEATIKAFTAVELADMIERANLSYSEGLERLRQAGMEAIPGGGAEIFDEELRSRICPDKGSTKVWLEMHRTAHSLGIKSNATILYGHYETLEQRVDHLERLRSLQDQTGGFNAFIPLKYRNFGNSMSDLGEVSIVEDMKMLALSRIYLDNIPHIKSYWVMYGRDTTEMALAFGADDIDGTIDDSTKIYSMAGAEDKRPKMNIEQMENLIRRAGFVPAERDTHYNEIKRV
ncbi:MAG: CofH family radical SAM protein [Rikenellaceae bacterium]